jgi:hypothetical protein
MNKKKNTVEREFPPILDKFGSIMKLGDLVACVGSNSTTTSTGNYRTTTMIYFGHLSKITKATNIVYVQTFKVNDNDIVKEIRVKNNAAMVLIDETLLGKITLAKLTYHKV